MLKIEKLEVINTLTDEEMREVGIASMNLTSGKGQEDAGGGSPSDDYAKAVKADGTFKLFKAGTGVNAALGLSAKLMVNDGEEPPTPFDLEASPSDVTVELHHDLVREFVFPKAESNSAVTTDIIVADGDLPLSVTTENGITVTATENEEVTNRLILKVADGMDAATAVKVTIKNVKIATGTASDPNLASDHKFKFCPVGDVHIDACCRFLDGKDVKPNETSFTIRAENPFTKVITLG